MKKKIISIILILSITALLLPGCVFVSRDFRMTRNDIIKELGDVEVETEVQLQIGPGLLSAGKLAVSIADVDDDVRGLLKEIRNVQVGVYKVVNSQDGKIKIPAKISRKLEKKGYEPMVRVKQRDEAVLVMTKMRRNRLEALYVIALDREELVLVEVQGRLGKLIEKAIRDHGFNKGEFGKI